MKGGLKMKDKNYLYINKLNGSERNNHLDYSDFDSLKAKAKEMSKEDLEDIYIDERNKKEMSPGLQIFLFIFVMAFLLFLAYGLISIGEVSNKVTVSSNLKIITEDICGYLPEGYSSQELFSKDVDSLLVNKINCPNFNKNER
jgi:hypothetical protein